MRRRRIVLMMLSCNGINRTHLGEIDSVAAFSLHLSLMLACLHWSIAKGDCKAAYSNVIATFFKVLQCTTVFQCIQHTAEGCIAFLPCIEVLNTGVGQIDSCFELLQCAHFSRLGVLSHCTVVGFGHIIK